MKKMMRDPKPTEKPGIVTLMFVGRIGRGISEDLELDFGPPDSTQLDEHKAFMDAHRAAREKLGYHPQPPEPRYMFEEEFGARGDGMQQKGVPNMSVDTCLRELYDEGYFLIAARYWVDERQRDVSRLTYSCKESDRPLEQLSPSRTCILTCLNGRVFGHGHGWDRRFIDVTNGQQLGNNTISICGSEQTPEVCGTYRVLHFGNSGEVKDPSGLYSFDVVKRQAQAVAASTRPQLKMAPPSRKAPPPLTAPVRSFFREQQRVVMNRDGHPEIVLARASRGKR